MQLIHKYHLQFNVFNVTRFKEFSLTFFNTAGQWNQGRLHKSLKYIKEAIFAVACTSSDLCYNMFVPEKLHFDLCPVYLGP